MKQTAGAPAEHEQEVRSLNLNLNLQAWWGLLKSTWRRIHHRSHCGRERERSVLVWFHHCIPVQFNGGVLWIDRVTLQNHTLAAPDSHLICRPRAKLWQGENLHRPTRVMPMEKRAMVLWTCLDKIKEKKQLQNTGRELIAHIPRSQIMLTTPLPVKCVRAKH